MMTLQEKESKLWGGRFSSETSPVLEKLNASIKYDWRLWREDVKGSKCYARALQKTGILTQEELTVIQDGLSKVEEEWSSNNFKIKSTDEDIHTANERRLKELIGGVAGKLHTGRSRNDQVATDMRIWLRDKMGTLNSFIHDFIQIVTDRARREVHILMPGYTHLQRAQPVLWSHWLLSHAWNLRADSERLSQLSARADEMPLGSGALAGNPFPVDRPALARDLGFSRCSPNSMRAVGDRDFIAEFLWWACLCAVHLSRLAEDLVLFGSQEFGFVRLADCHSTGSSLMPHKRNPDGLELIRGRAGRILGQCTGFMAVLKGLPSTYNKDLQEDKEAMFDVCDSMESILQVAAGAVGTLTVNSDKCRSALTPDMLATDVAYYLVRKGMEFRVAHSVAGKVVALAEKMEVAMSELTMEHLKSVSECFEEDVRDVWNYESSVDQYRALGGTSSSSVAQQLDQMDQWLKNCASVQ
ncbi:argininosuccinate lyase isoform X2 [Bacillus rossius redtenbacheri]|uniref:argininosuccinate lyase isoform X2 n=1 Tax=Bacillus rossius redtenbacheri TaxID=93214 RepID=UPI002FDEE5A0